MPINDVVNKGNFLIYLQPPQMSKKKDQRIDKWYKRNKRNKITKKYDKKNSTMIQTFNTNVSYNLVYYF